MVNRVENNQDAAPSDAPRDDDPELLAGQELRRLRTARGWSQEEVARRMKAYGYDFHQTTIAKVEAAQRPLRVRELAHFAALFGVPVNQLFYRLEHGGSLGAIEQEIAALTAQIPDARAHAEQCSHAVHAAQADVADHQHVYNSAANDLAVMLGRMDFLRHERDKLTGTGDGK
jgi:transcriptional regulator with XRE-family HTH domain